MYEVQARLIILIFMLVMMSAEIGYGWLVLAGCILALSIYLGYDKEDNW